MSAPYAVVAGGVRVFVRLTPRARREVVEGVVVEPDGRAALKVAVTAPPEDGRANAALVALLGKSWRLPKSSITIVGGAADRRKALLVAGDPASLTARIAAHLATLDRKKS